MKGPKFAPTPSHIPHKDIVAEIEAAITDLPDESKDSVRTSAANLLRRCQLPSHKNTSANERKAINICYPLPTYTGHILKLVTIKDLYKPYQ